MSHQQDLNQTVMGIISDERVLGTNSVVRIGAICVVEINGEFFLIVEIRIGTQAARVLVITITAELAAALERSGVDICTVSTMIPVSTPGRVAELQCAFVVDEVVILVFIIRSTTDEIVLVRVPLCASACR